MEAHPGLEGFRYEPGDRVKVREDLFSDFNQPCRMFGLCGETNVDETHLEFAGETVTIESCKCSIDDDDHWYFVEENSCPWTDEMFEGLSFEFEDDSRDVDEDALWGLMGEIYAEETYG